MLHPSVWASASASVSVSVTSMPPDARVAASSAKGVGRHICANLSSTQASVLTPRGIVSSAWQCGAGSSSGGGGGGGGNSSSSTDTAVCGAGGTLGGMITEMWNTGRTAEIGEITLTCTDGGAIKAIDFASYGLPTGTCNSSAGSAGSGYTADPRCNAVDTVAKVSALCVGKSTCTIVGAFSVFGDPCVDTVKRLAIAASGCVGKSTTNVPPTPAPPAPDLFTYTVGVPSGATADVYLPAMHRGVANITVTEVGEPAGARAGGGTVVWSKGGFNEGTPGVLAARSAGGDGQELIVEVASGQYTFVVSEK